MKNQQLELFKVNPTWFHFFNELLRSGAWAKMSLAAKALYPCIKSFCNQYNGQAFPSLETLTEFSGLSTKSVLKGLAELEMLGMLKSEKSTGRQTKYTIREALQPLDNNGQPTGDPIYFDYIPKLILEAIKQIKDYVDGGMKDDRPFPLLQINITTNNHINIGGTQIINSIEPKILFQGLHDRFEGRDTPAAKYAESVEKACG